MDQSRRFLPRLILLALGLAAFSLTAQAQPGPAKTDAPVSTKAAPVGGPAVPTSGPVMFGPPAPMLSPALNGIISPEEYAKYREFQQQVSQDPAVKELNAKISLQIKELKELQGEASALRDKLIAANPEIKAIQDKILAAGRARAHSMPTNLPARMMVPPAGPAPTSTPAPAKTN